MNWKLFFATYISIFIAELGDKTQLATLVYASKCKFPILIFLASALALITSSLLAVVVGQGLGKLMPLPLITKIGGGLFIIFGIMMLFGKL